jgi:hypothetical protein
MSPGIEESAPRASRTSPVETATPIGHANVRPRPRSEARRQAISGPIPMRIRSGSPKALRKKL